jgi:hypothetical protein
MSSAFSWLDFLAINGCAVIAQWSGQPSNTRQQRLTAQNE